MNTIQIPDSTRRWDCLSLGEVMLRLDPAEGRIHTTRNFQVWEGGGEYNVARRPAPLFRFEHGHCYSAGR